MKPPFRRLILCEHAVSAVSGQESLSAAGLKVRRALGLAGLSVAFRYGEDTSPVGVPVLLVGQDEVVVGATAILARIEARVPGALVPVDARPDDAAEAWLWAEFAERTIGPLVSYARWADPRNWPQTRDAYFHGASWIVRTFVAPHVRREMLRGFSEDALGDSSGHRAEYRRILDLLELRSLLEGFWGGRDRPSVADVTLFAELHSLRSDLTPWHARELSLRPALTDWLDRVGAADLSARQPAEPPSGIRTVVAPEAVVLEHPSDRRIGVPRSAEVVCG